MSWVINFFNEVTKQFNALVVFMNTPIEGLNDALSMLGADVTITPIALVSTLLVTYILAMFLLRIVRG